MKIYNFFAFVLLLINISELISQNYYFEPISFNYSSTISPLTPDEFLDTKILPLVNVDSLLQIERDLDSAGILHPTYYGFGFEVNFSINNSGTWDTLESGDRLWRLKIICPESYEINFVFHNFKMGDSTFVFIYDTSKSFVLGPYTSRDNDTSFYYTTHLSRGDIAFIEYFEPQNCNQERYLEVEEVVSGYKNLFYDIDSMQYKKNNDNNILTNWYDCYRDANCPEGDDYCREKYSVALGIYKNNYVIWSVYSAVLINNTNPDDYRPILLTARHNVTCYELYLQYYHSFRFGFMKSGCGSGNIIKFWDYSGANRYILEQNTDIALIRLRRNFIPGDFAPYPDILYWSGWNNSNTHIPTNTICLNHPGNPDNIDNVIPLKIAVDNESPVISGRPDPLNNCMENETDFCWRVRFNSGMARDGSSGSPLYNEAREVVGVVYYGCADCDNTDGPIYFNRFSRFWDFVELNNNSAATFLDPEHRGYSSVKGKKLPVNIYGRIFHNNNYYHAFNKIRFGSKLINGYALPFYLAPPLAPSLMTIKAGEEIIFRPCTQILEGTNLHAYIQPDGCDFYPEASEPDNVYTSDCNEYLMASNVYDTENKMPKHIKYIEEKYMYVIPNPAYSSIDVVYKIKSAGKAQLIITNSYGHQVYNANLNYINATNEQKHSIDISTFPSGLYFVTLRSPAVALTKGVVVLK